MGSEQAWYFAPLVRLGRKHKGAWWIVPLFCLAYLVTAVVSVFTSVFHFVAGLFRR